MDVFIDDTNYDMYMLFVLFIIKCHVYFLLNTGIKYFEFFKSLTTKVIQNEVLIAGTFRIQSEMRICVSL